MRKLLLLLLACGACANDSLPGTYYLERISLAPLPIPVEYTDDSTNVYLTGSALTLAPDGTWQERMTVRELRRGVATMRDLPAHSGTFTIDGAGKISLQETGVLNIRRGEAQGAGLEIWDGFYREVYVRRPQVASP